MSESIYTVPEKWRLDLFRNPPRSFKNLNLTQEELWVITHLELDKSISGPCDFGTEEFKQVILSIFGVDNVSKLKWVKDKKQKTFLSNHNEFNDMMALARQHLYKKYNITNVSQLEQVKEKKKQKAIKRYGVDNVSKSDEVKDQIKTTMKNKYGGWFNSTEDGKQKIKQGYIEKYGVDNYSKTEEFKEQQTKFLMDRHRRPIIEKIKQLQKENNVTIGRGWTNRSDEKLNELYEGMKNDC